jgi:hypothetical protein
MIDLAKRANVGLSTVERCEAGRLERMQVSSIRSIGQAFGLSMEVSARGLGAREDRLLDHRHAALLGACATWLARLEWQVQPEVSYSEFGERGSIDLLAWHARSATLLVVEIKTEIGSVEATLRKLDEKVRLGPRIARSLGWRPTSVSRLLVLPDESTQHRRIQAHASVFDPAFPVRTRQVRAWCRTPSGSIAGLLFLPHPERKGGGRSQSHGERVRLAHSPDHGAKLLSGPAATTNTTPTPAATPADQIRPRAGATRT